MVKMHWRNVGSAERGLKVQGMKSTVIFNGTLSLASLVCFGETSTFYLRGQQTLACELNPSCHVTYLCKVLLKHSSAFFFFFYHDFFPHLEKAMATNSSTLAWEIPRMEEPGRLQSMGSLRVRHDWATSLSLFTFMHWRRKWQPTPVFLPGEPQGWWSLVGCCLWGRTELDTTEVT